jgi:hypothetical protein
MSRPPLTQSARQQIVANTLGSLRIENLSPSESLKAGLDAYVAGEKSTADLLNEIRSKYLTLRQSGDADT